jgi:histidinol-phosphate phosphatase family protein
MNRKTVFLDRDGVINENRDNDYVKGWDEFRFLPKTKDAIKALTDANWDIIVVSNQAGIGRGVMSAQSVEEINARMVEEIEKDGGRIKAVYYCPHRPDANCDCRKPKPGMLLRAATEFGVDLLNSYLIGDSLSDIQAAAQVGCKTILVKTGRGIDSLERREQWIVDPDYVVLNLLEATNLVLAIDRICLQRKYTSGSRRPVLSRSAALSFQSVPESPR